MGIDGTYNVNDLRYPLLILTLIDKCHHVHQIAFCIANSEDEDAYTFFIEAIMKSYEVLEMLEKEKYNPEYVISDGAPAIFNTIEKSFKTTHPMWIWHLKE